MTHGARHTRWAGRLAVGLALAMICGGCVQREYDDVRAAKAAYERCVAEVGGSVDTCRDQADAYNRAVERYVGASRNAWGCDPAQPDCPTPR